MDHSLAPFVWAGVYVPDGEAEVLMARTLGSEYAGDQIEVDGVEDLPVLFDQARSADLRT